MEKAYKRIINYGGELEWKMYIKIVLYTRMKITF